MIAAITTYMVIFIQFMPKEDPTKTAQQGNMTMAMVADISVVTTTITSLN